MEKQTIVCTVLPNGRATDGALLLSVHIALRLWSSDTSVSKLPLSQFPDLLAWPATLTGAGWSLTFDGQPPVGATVVSAAPRADLWSALFKTDTDVVPFRFEDHCDTVIETIDSAAIHDMLSTIYARAATELGYGGGKDLPSVETLAGDPDLRDIARATVPAKLPDPGPKPPPLDLGGKLPEPKPEPPRPPEEPRPPEGGRRWCRCICWLLGWLAKPFPKFAAWADRICAATPAQDAPPKEETGPTSWAIPTKGIPPGAPLKTTPSPVPEPPLSFTPSDPPSPKKLIFDAIAAFVTPPPPAAKPLPTAAELEEIYDFHSMIASLGDYPKLMRMLGLVVDLRVEIASPAASGTVKAEPTMPFATATTVASPRTHYLLDDKRFLAAPRAGDAEISNGLLRLSDEAQFRVIQIDVVGSALKLQNAATNMMIVSDKTRRPPNSPGNAGLPALRTSGVSVVRRDFKSELQKQFLRSTALQRMLAAKDSSPAPAPVTIPAPNPTDELFAEDLVRGYRIDVFDTKWRSLCRRMGTYDFLAAPDAPGGAISLELDDEGFVQFAATTERGADTSASLRTTDSLFVWDGWSLCAPRPGKTVMADDKPDGTTNLDTPTNEAKTKFKFESSFKAKPGSLPRLRYGQTYSLRARICDLAGNSVFEPDAPSFAADVPEQTPPFAYGRYEPVSPPAVLQRAAPVEGESLERMVVRTPAIGGTDQATERHIIPPKISQLVAEQHGKFDAPLADPAKMNGTTAGYDLAARESGALNDGASKIATAPAGQPANASELIWVFSGEQHQLTYLPDPASRGALLLGLPGLSADEVVEPPAPPALPVNKIPFGGSWPELASFRLQLKPIAGSSTPSAPLWDETKRILAIELPEAQKRVVRLSSFFGTTDFAQRGINDWVKKQAPAAAGTFEADAVSGRSWLHLPWRDITLVHAVQRPLQTTNITKLSADKKIGATSAILTGEIAPHVLSTGKVDIVAQWEDPIDDPGQPAPGTRVFRSHLCEVLVPEDADPFVAVEAGSDKKPPVHQFHDTKFHRVTYRTVATTRFREYFPVTVTKDASNITLENPAGISVPVLNSARPDAPRVLYIVPTYGWKKDAPGGASTSHHRKGNGLRVYLDRPWYSSGDDERLGIVFIPDAKFMSLTKTEKALVTQWAADPIWLSDPTTEFARMANFLGTADTGVGLTLAETGQMVSAAGYKVEFDATRRLWFADITLDIGPSYTPFVRLALARFQPNSVDSVHLSRIVQADFLQLAADRSATYTTTAAGSGAKIDILVKGPAYTASAVTLASDRNPDLFGKESGRAGRSEIEARLQRRNSAFGAQEELGWDTVTTELLTQNTADPGIWQGTVTSALVPKPGQFRILLLEYEWYRSDFSTEDEHISLARRIVYADALSLG